MVASKLTKYMNEKNGNGVVVSSWDIDTGLAGSARCNYCETDVKFKSGKAALLVHSETGKHITNTKKKINSVKHQITIGESLQASQGKDEEDVRLETKKGENLRPVLARSLSNHKIPFQFLECLQDQLKKYCGDSEVAKSMKLSRCKGEVILRHGVGRRTRMRLCDSYRNVMLFLYRSMSRK